MATLIGIGGSSSGSGAAIQKKTMPTPSATNLGKIYQYVGTTDANYTNGYFYKCVLDGSNYKWQQTDVQPANGSNGIIYGYLHEGAMYQDSQHTTAIVPTATNRYVDMTTASAPKDYMWDGTQYVEMDSDKASAERLGVVERILSYAMNDLNGKLTGEEFSQNVAAAMSTIIETLERVTAAALIDQQIRQLQSTVIAPTYSNIETYDVGDYAIMNNVLYKCNTAIPVCEIFHHAKWTQTSVMGEILLLMSQQAE